MRDDSAPSSSPESRQQSRSRSICRADAGHNMSGASQPVDLTQVPAVPWAWVDEHVYAAIRGCSVKVLQKERRLNVSVR